LKETVDDRIEAAEKAFMEGIRERLKACFKRHAPEKVRTPLSSTIEGASSSF